MIANLRLFFLSPNDPSPCYPKIGRKKVFYQSSLYSYAFIKVRAKLGYRKYMIIYKKRQL